MAVSQDLVTQICGDVRKDVLEGINQSVLPAGSGNLFQVSYSIAKGAVGKHVAHTWA